MEFHIITPYSRDRKPELYLWTLAMYMEPHYSQGRMVTSKIAQFVTVLDDTYDAYATIEELRLLTNAINRYQLNKKYNILCPTSTTVTCMHPRILHLRLVFIIHIVSTFDHS